MPSPLEILRAAGSVPFKIGTLAIDRAISAGRGELMDANYGHSYTGMPITVSIPKNIQGMSTADLHGDFSNKMLQALGDAKYQNGQWWKQTPFLWSSINTPIHDTIPVGDFVRREGKILNAAMGIPEADARYYMANMANTVYGGALQKGIKTIPDTSLSNVGTKSAYIAEALKRLPAGVQPNNVRLFRSSPIMGMNNFYDIAKNEVGLSKLHPALIMHEFGHVADIGGSKWKAPWLRANNYMDRGLRYLVPAAIVGGTALSNALPGSVDDAIFDAMKNYGPEAWLATRATGPLMAEFNANRWANKQIAELAKDPALAQSIKPNTFRNWRLANWAGFGKYLFNTAVPYGLFAALRRMAKNNEIEKTSSVVDMAKGLASEVIVRPIRGAKVMLQNRDVVTAPFEAPTSASIKAMLTSPAAKELAISAIVPTLLGAAYLSAAQRQKDALKDSEAAKLPYYRMLGNMYPGLEVTPWLMDQMSERFLT